MLLTLTLVMKSGAALEMLRHLLRLTLAAGRSYLILCSGLKAQENSSSLLGHSNTIVKMNFSPVGKDLERTPALSTT